MRTIYISIADIYRCTSLTESIIWKSSEIINLAGLKYGQGLKI